MKNRVNWKRKKKMDLEEIISKLFGIRNKNKNLYFRILNRSRVRKN